jgi:hypothetical protein
VGSVDGPRLRREPRRRMVAARPAEVRNSPVPGSPAVRPGDQQALPMELIAVPIAVRSEPQLSGGQKRAAARADQKTIG